MTLATMVPAAVKRATRLPANLIIHLADPARLPADQLQNLKISPKTRTIFEQLHFFLSDGPKPEHEVLSHANIARPMLKRLLALNLLRMERKIKLPEHLPPGANLNSPFTIHHSPLQLSPDQQSTMDSLNTLLAAPKFAVRLLHGVTGSGKTELYIRAIDQVVAKGQRAIVLVPEISLTPQAVRRFTARFPRVAVLHSGLKDSERHQHWHAIASGWAQVIVGARSAIFAPAADLGLIVVDEEHDPSYKQDNLPKYHGRDVAIRRAQMLNIPIILGSATPSLESWQNATKSPGNTASTLPKGTENACGVANPTYSTPQRDDSKSPDHQIARSPNLHWQLLSLRSRPLNTQMPRVITVDMKAQSKERRGLHILSTILEHHLKQTLAHKKQVIFLLNRRGYAHYVMCPRCDWVLMCENCDTTMVVHRTSSQKPEARSQNSAIPNHQITRSPDHQIHHSPFTIHHSKVMCHYCLTAMQLPDLCPLCRARLTHLGQGTQRAEDELLRKFPNIRLKRMDSDSMRDAADYQESLDAFGRGEIDLLLGTQMISKGLDFPNVQLVGVLNSDLAMTIPDFRAAERTFQLICQVAGRAGRPSLDEVSSFKFQVSSESSGNSKLETRSSNAIVIVQTFQPHEPAILHACNHDYLSFVQSELPHRQAFGYPPFGRLIRILLAHKSYTQVQSFGTELARLITALTQKLSLPIRMQGPIPPPMERVNELYRVEIILFSSTPAPLQHLLSALRARGVLTSKTNQVTVTVDVDPLHML